MLQMRELGLGNFASIDHSKVTAGDVCFISNYAFTELSREMQNAYADQFIHHADRGVILSNAAVFADHMQSRDNNQIIELLSKHGIMAKEASCSTILCGSDRSHGNVIVGWGENLKS
jgi:translation elongation factor EF-4